jgi:L-amino acid N-acyltransferase YncA
VISPESAWAVLCLIGRQIAYGVAGPTREAAIRAYEKVGFRRVGVMRSYERGPDGSWHDNLLMDLLAGELR